MEFLDIFTWMYVAINSSVLVSKIHLLSQSKCNNSTGFCFLRVKKYSLNWVFIILQLYWHIIHKQTLTYDYDERIHINTFLWHYNWNLWVYEGKQYTTFLYCQLLKFINIVFHEKTLSVEITIHIGMLNKSMTPGCACNYFPKIKYNNKKLNSCKIWKIPPNKKLNNNFNTHT